MEISNFIQHFAEQFDDADISMFTPDTIFRELDEYSSLIALSIIAMVDEEYNVTLTGNEMKSVATIKELYTIVTSKI